VTLALVLSLQLILGLSLAEDRHHSRISRTGVNVMTTVFGENIHLRFSCEPTLTPTLKGIKSQF
jgi:hypothetical protein